MMIYNGSCSDCNYYKIAGYILGPLEGMCTYKHRLKIVKWDNDICKYYKGPLPPKFWDQVKEIEI